MLLYPLDAISSSERYDPFSPITTNFHVFRMHKNQPVPCAIHFKGLSNILIMIVLFCISAWSKRELLVYPNTRSRDQRYPISNKTPPPAFYYLSIQNWDCLKRLYIAGDGVYFSDTRNHRHKKPDGEPSRKVVIRCMLAFQLSPERFSLHACCAQRAFSFRIWTPFFAHSVMIGRYSW